MSDRSYKTKGKPVPVHSFYTAEHLAAIKEYPHLIGHIAGRDKLTPLHSEWIKYIWTGGLRQSLMAHRGSFKSTAIGVIGSVWHLLFHPEDRIFIVRKTYQDACDTVSTIAKVMDQPEIRELFLFAHGTYPDFDMRREGKISFTFKKSKTPEPSVMAFGLSSPFTGRHCDFLLCDDISTLKDRLSKAEREFTKQMWFELSTNIIDRGKPCCYIGTPWHPDGVESLIPKPKMYSVYDCGLISPMELAEIKAGTTPALFAANYELKFVAADDALFKDPQIGKWRAEGASMIRAHVDAAYGMSDLCALTIGSYIDGKNIQYVGFAAKVHIKDWIPFIASMMGKYKAKKIYVEKQSDRGMTASLLRNAGLSVVEYDENLNKQHKIAAYLYEIWPRLTFSDDTDDAYLQQITDWTPESKEHDDACLVAGTLVATPRGNIPIERIVPGDKVITPFGMRRVAWAGCTGEARTIRTQFLEGTPDHKVYEGRTNSFVAMENLTPDSAPSMMRVKELITWKIHEQLYSMEGSTGEESRRNITSLPTQLMQNAGQQSNFMLRFGNSIMELLFQKGTTYTIRTLIQIIMILAIWCAWRGANILRFMLATMKKIQNMSRRTGKPSRKHKNSQSNGMLQKRDALGIKNMHCTLSLGRSAANPVAIAERSLPPDQEMRYIAPGSAVVEDIENNAEKPGGLLFTRKFRAVSAADFSPNSIAGTRIALLNVKPRKGEAIAKVYNLVVENAGMFYANGVLVSNCDSASALSRAVFSTKGPNSERWRW